MFSPGRINNEKGFTLIELTVVVAVIGILATIAVVVYNDFLKKARTIEAKSFLSTLARQQTAYYVANDQYTTDTLQLGLPALGGLKYYDDPEIIVSGDTFTATMEGNIDTDSDVDEWTINEKKELLHTIID